ncbi:MAG: hypothetical protein ACHQ5A_01035 [Opitutales bacterium]
MLTGLLDWLDAAPWHYWCLAWAAFAIFLLSATLPFGGERRWGRWNPPHHFAGSLFLFLAAFRWPVIGLNHQLPNPDESQLIASALTYRHFGTLWGHVDGMSSGPLVSLPLILPALLGWPINYQTARLVGLLASGAMVLLLWLTLRHQHGDRRARLLVVPPACAVAFTTYWDYLQYSSEQVPLAHCALALWLVVTAFSPAGVVRSLPRLACAGLVLGLLPLGKLQLVPLGLVLGLAVLVWLARSSSGPAPRRLRAAGWLLGGTGLAVAGTALSLWWSGAGHDFWLTHVYSNLHYADQRAYGWKDFPDAFWVLLHEDAALTGYLVPAGLLLAAGLLAGLRLRSASPRLPVLAAALLVTALYVVGAPGRLYPHYLLILIPFTAFALGGVYAGLVESARCPPRAPAALLAVFLVFSVAPQIWFRATAPHPYLGRRHTPGPNDPRAAVAQFVRKATRPGDTLAVWGWMPRFFVETGLPQATREAHTQRELRPWVLSSYLLDRYLADLARNRPAVFLDAVGKDNYLYHDRVLDGHETRPALRDYIAQHYYLAGEIATTRIYLRNDRAPPPPVTSGK